MNLREIDWHYLRQGLTASVVLLLGGLILWGASTLFRARLTSNLETERQSLVSLEHDRNDLTNRREVRRQFANLYGQLHNQGAFSGDQRLIWVQNVRDAAAALGLPYLRYVTSPQRAFEAPWLIPGAAASVTVSLMDLQLGLVHEQDLLRLFARLRNSPGLLQIESCALQRMAENPIPQPDEANIRGSCQLAWFSLSRETALAAANAGS